MRAGRRSGPGRRELGGGERQEHGQQSSVGSEMGENGEEEVGEHWDEEYGNQDGEEGKENQMEA